MPSSWYQAIPAIIDLVLMDKPKSILDLGAGFGKYGVILREACDIPYERYEKADWQIEIDGVEGHVAYRNPVHEYIYDHMHYGDILAVLETIDKTYDTVLLIDVLEHFEKDKGHELIKAILHKTNRSLLISTPIHWHPQEPYLGNELEVHRSRWNIVDFVDYDYQFSQVKIGDNGANLFKLYPPKHPLKKDKSFNIAYILPHHQLTGGMKMLLSQIEGLRKKGHSVTAIYKGEEGESVLPSWSRVTVDREVLVPRNRLVRDYLQDSEFVVAGWVQQVLELVGLDQPVLYWEQGHEWLFGDVKNPRYIDQVRREMEVYYTSGIHVASVSRFVARVLQARYNLPTTVIPNGIDIDLYCPGKSKKGSASLKILLIGNPSLPFKCHDTALKVLEELWRRGNDFKVDWLSPVDHSVETIYPLNVIVHPKEEVLIEYYQQADFLLYTSWYEGFGMPPLEAMACRTAVIATKCGGIDEYAIHQFNCLLAEPGDVEQLVNHAETLLTDTALREYLAENGRQTSYHFSYDRVIPQLEKCIEHLLVNKNQNELQKQPER